MLVEVRVQSLRLDKSTGSPVVILEDIEGERVLPIWIGHGEAHAISAHLAEQKYPRPLTHDLLASVIETFGGRLNEVKISRVEASVYLAEMVCQHGDEVLTLDARPSDSIAVALRLNAKIFADDDLLNDAPVDSAVYEPDKPKGADDAPEKKIDGD
jgi:bifunctional DNase/RNase